jgi:hypothetical protein
MSLKVENTICEYCELPFKNNHGLHIHWHYCLTKGFSEMEKVYIKPEKMMKLKKDEMFIYMGHLPPSYLKYLEDGELGVKHNKRYILSYV